MKYKIEEIEGIGAVYKRKLAAAGLKTTDHLLQQCCKARGRKEMSAKTGIGESQFLGWVNMADLMRITGVGRQYAELLEASGVDTIKELRNRRADNLAVKMKEVNAKKKLAKNSPPASVIQRWIDQAKATKPLVTH